MSEPAVQYTKEYLKDLTAKRAEKIRLHAARILCEQEHLFFVRYFFKQRHALKFRVNWHHVVMADAIEKVLDGRIKNLVVNVPPGSSKTELFVINLIARGLAKNPRARFLHLSGSDSLALLNSELARDLILSDHYQAFWPLKISADAKSKKRWNIEINGYPAGGVYATSLGGQITGFRAGHMAEGFQGAIIIDDPVKPEDAFSKKELAKANRKLLSTVRSRRANPETPIIVVMQRVAESDPSGFIEKGNLQGEFTFIKIPALLTEADARRIAPELMDRVDSTLRDDNGRFSYWPYKEPLNDLLKLERGEGFDDDGKRVSRYVYASQYGQSPKALGGNLIHGQCFYRYKGGVVPKLKYRKIYGDTAQKTKEANDWSVFIEAGLGDDGRAYVLNLIRGKWESPELKRRAIAFWSAASARNSDHYGNLREMLVEDKSSGTDLVQTLALPPPDGANIPIKGIERNRDKFSRVNDALPYIEVQLVAVPEDAPFTHDLIAECEAFTADDSHDWDDQVDALVDMVMDMLSSENSLKNWEQLGKQRQEKIDAVNKLAGVANGQAQVETVKDRWKRLEQRYLKGPASP